jgi:F-type H+-transporting ATPase subunit b
MNPQWFTNQLFWLVICFTLLYLIVSRGIVPNVSSVLNTRKNAIDEAIAEAETLKRTAAQAQGDFEQASREARAKAAKLLADAQAQANKEAAEAQSELSADLAKKLASATKSLQDAQKKALKSLDEASQSLAQAMADKLLGATVESAEIVPLPAKKRG